MLEEEKFLILIYIKNMIKTYQDTAIVCLPSYREGFSRVFQEAAAIGLPIVSTHHADIPNVIPLENHFLGVERNVDSLFNQFKILLDIKDWNKIERNRKIRRVNSLYTK